MKREDVKNKITGITEEQPNWLMQENGSDITREKFLSTLSLRRATTCYCSGSLICNFYPRSPCGERRAASRASSAWTAYFYPRSPCGERRRCSNVLQNHFAFLSTLSLRRATQVAELYATPTKISIHALLAESDGSAPQRYRLKSDFYPRSPCGERPSPMRNYIQCCVFLSTLSLRRATASRAATISGARYFYPRSPCGERRNRVDPCGNPTHISIHALLAESDRL